MSNITGTIAIEPALTKVEEEEIQKIFADKKNTWILKDNYLYWSKKGNIIDASEIRMFDKYADILLNEAIKSLPDKSFTGEVVVIGDYGNYKLSVEDNSIDFKNLEVDDATKVIETLQDKVDNSLILLECIENSASNYDKLEKDQLKRYIGLIREKLIG